MKIDELKAINEIDDIAFGHLYALSKLGENAGVKKEAKKALERSRPAEYAALKAVFRAALGRSFSEILPDSGLPEALLVSVAKAVLLLTGNEKLGFRYLSSVRGEPTVFALQSAMHGDSLFLHGFKGTLPGELAEVKGLKNLRISGNQLTEFPVILYDLKELESLSINETKIKKVEDEFTKLKKLKSLSIEMPLKKGLGELPALKKLRIGIVPDVAKCFLPSLEEFTMGNDKMTKIPAGIAAMKKLKKLYWPREVTEIDEGLWTLVELEELELSGLHMESLSEGIGNLTKLRHLSLRGVRLTHLPESFGKLKGLEELDLVFARSLTAVPASFYDLPLKRLRIQYSPLEKMQSDFETKMPNVTIYK